MIELPQPIAALVDELAASHGAIAVVLGGSRAFDGGSADSDWDLGVYYRGAMDLGPLAAHGVVHPPGAWGRVMNGGAWLSCGSHKVDVLLRDLDAVEHWTQRAEAGQFEVDALLGYTAGIPTYVLAAELAACRVLHGSLPRVSFPRELMVAAPPKWRFCRTFSLEYARVHARRGSFVGAVAQAAKAALEEAHARVCERGQWVCNEKRLLDTAGLAEVEAVFARRPAEVATLESWVNDVAAALGGPDETIPWSDAGRER